MDKALLDDILFRYKHPRLRGELSDAVQLQDANISCGDEIKLFLRITDGKIVDAKYSGQMCSVASYGAELLAEKIVGSNIESASAIDSRALLPSGCSLLKNPVRLKCFEIAQRALKKQTKSQA